MHDNQQLEAIVLLIYIAMGKQRKNMNAIKYTEQYMYLKTKLLWASSSVHNC